MTLSSLTYTPPIRRRQRSPKLDYELLETAVELAGKGEAKASVLKVYEHLFPTTPIPDLATETFRFTQGSSRVTSKIEGDSLKIAVPLVKLPNGGAAIAALRYVLSKVSGSGQLHQPRLIGDDLHLEFHDKLSRLHPAKVVEALRRMPATADAHDDWLIGQFGALPLERESVLGLSEEEATRAESIWRLHWQEVDELLKESQRKRSLFFLNELTAYAVYRLQSALPLCGFLNARINESASTFNNSDEDPLKRENSLAKCIKDMSAVTSEDLRKSLGHVEYALSPLTEGTPQVLSGYFGEVQYMETIDKLRKSGSPLDGALALACTFNYLLARFSWPDVVRTELEAGLAIASEKSWRDAIGLMYDHAREIAAKYGEDAEGDDEADEEADATDEAAGDE
jgi:hypothetical protein